ncbi:hypothetical protein CHCC20335_1017 [Bacillus paralicheniformis]|nr:hypothetical protein CHCC20335_1017 [Bacillus paralicheniformis]
MSRIDNNKPGTWIKERENRQNNLEASAAGWCFHLSMIQFFHNITEKFIENFISLN